MSEYGYGSLIDLIVKAGDQGTESREEIGLYLAKLTMNEWWIIDNHYRNLNKGE